MGSEQLDHLGWPYQNHCENTTEKCHLATSRACRQVFLLQVVSQRERETGRQMSRDGRLVLGDFQGYTGQGAELAISAYLPWDRTNCK